VVIPAPDDDPPDDDWALELPQPAPRRATIDNVAEASVAPEPTND
jgi:hypothetical protein